MRNFEEEENIKEQKQAVGVGGSLRYILFWQEIKIYNAKLKFFIRVLFLTFIYDFKGYLSTFLTFWYPYLFAFLKN